jgi:hypothetical protein
VPAEIETRLVARQAIDGASAEVRVVRVLPTAASVAFRDGWPNGNRPPDAWRPASVR